MDDPYNFRGMLEKVGNRDGAINHPDRESGREGKKERRREREARGAAYAPRIIMIIGGLIKTLRYNASGYRRQPRGRVDI